MEMWIALVGGIIIGWVGEWIVDWLYWRRGLAALYANTQELRTLLAARTEEAQIASEGMQNARVELDAWRRRYESLSATEKQLRTEVTVLTAKLEALTAHETELQAAFTDATTRVGEPLDSQITSQSLAAKRDDLERISGIGPVYEQRLFDAGIETYAQLAATPVDRLRAIVQPIAIQKVDFAKWIEEARRFAAVVLGDQLPYRLEEIRGIGPTYARRLNAAGIVTYQDLARANQRQLHDIIKPASWQNVDFQDWIKQARAFAALAAGNHPVLPLQQIKGIGPVSALRLELAGISTIAQLAETPEARLREIIGVNQQGYSGWIEQARALAMSSVEPKEATHA